MSNPNTLKRELGSLWCIYESCELNQKPLSNVENGRVDPRIQKVYGNTEVNEKDLFSFQYQGPVFKKWLEDNQFPTKGWSYGIFEKSTDKLTQQPGVSLPTTTIYDDIWKLLDQSHRQKFSNYTNGQKDSWDPADIYIFRGNKSKVIKYVEDVKEATKEFHKTNPNVFIALLNDYLRVLYNDKILVGISLKQASPPNIPEVEIFNVLKDDDFDPPEFGEATLRKTGNGFLHQWMQLGKKGGKLGFKGNSVRFEAEVNMGNKKTAKFSWESKSPGRDSPHTTEFKKLVFGNKGQLTTAAARGGSITKEIKFKPIIAEYIKKGPASWNLGVPKNPLKLNGSSKSHAKYWAKELFDLRKSKLTTLDDVKILRNPQYAKERGLPEVVVDASTNNLANNTAYFEELFKIDTLSQKEVKDWYGWEKESDYAKDFRGKLRGLIIIKAIVLADKDGKLGEILLRSFFTAGKVQWVVDDLYGPFVKIE